MKKIFAFLGILILSMTMGCAEPEEATVLTDVPTATQAVEPTTEPTTEPKAEPTTEPKAEPISTIIPEPTATIMPIATQAVEPTKTPMPTVTVAPTSAPELLTGLIMEIVPLETDNFYDDWWIDSELNIFIDSIPVKLTQGNVKMNMYVPEEGLADGEYAVELHIGEERYNTYANTINFAVKKGKPDIADSKKYKDGYLLEFEIPYADASSWEQYGIIIKTHCTADSQTGSLFFGNLSFEDEKKGRTSIELSRECLVISAQKFTSQERIEVYGLNGLAGSERQLLTMTEEQKPIVSPTITPMLTATVAPTATPVPTLEPTAAPVPTLEPTAIPTLEPTAIPATAKDFPFFATGLAVSSYNNGGKAYGDWWRESEVCTFISLPGSYSAGGYGATVYIRDGELKDGSYAVGITLCADGNPYAALSNTDTSFEIRNGKLNTENFMGIYQRINHGYLIGFSLGYNCLTPESNLSLAVKVYSNVTGENGNIYFLNLYVMDEVEGYRYLDLAADKYEISSKQLRTGNPSTYKIVSMAGIEEDFSDAGTVYEGEKYESLTKKNGEVFYSSGLAIGLENHLDKSYGEAWWEESEIMFELSGAFSKIKSRLSRGGYGFDIYIPNGYLKDGQYGVELFLSTENGTSACTSLMFGITNGVFDQGKSMVGATPVHDGYVARTWGFYDLRIPAENLKLVLKIHSSSSECNGELYVTNLFIADEVSGFTYVDFSKEIFSVSAKRYLTGESENVRLYVKEFNNRVPLVQHVSSLHVGEHFTLKAKNSPGVTFSSSDETVADISSKGVIMAKKPGTTEITVKDFSSGKKTTFILSVEPASVDVMIKKNRIVKGDTFTYMGKGLGMEEKEFIWTSSNPAVGTIDKYTGLFTGLKEGTTSITLTGKNSGVSRSFEVEVFSVKNSRIKDYITVVTNGLISSELEHKVTELLCDVYADVFDYYADGIYSPIICTFTDEAGVAYTTENEIYVSAAYINSNPKDVDCITHELIHCAQRYPSSDAIWLVEGIADYGRSLFGKYNEDVGWKLSEYKEGQDYTDSYTITAGFLDYVVKNHDKNLIHILNDALKVSQYSEDLWEVCTGYSVDELWEKYAGMLLVEKPTLIYVGESIPLQLTGSYQWKNVSFKVSGDGSVNISPEGIMTAKRAGIVRVTAKMGALENSWEVTVKEPYIEPLVVKAAVEQGEIFEYLAMGYGIKNAVFSWTSSDESVGIIEADTGLFTAVSVGNTLLTMKEKNSGKSYNFMVEVTAPKTLNPEEYIDFTRSEAVDDEMENRLYNLMCDVYEDVFDYFAYGQYSLVTCKFGYADGAAAYATTEKLIVYDENYARDFPASVDTITHELIHCAQGYYISHENVWLCEGIADYGRSLFGKYLEEADWKLKTYQSGQNYTDGYEVTGGFLKYVVENHNEDIVHILNVALKKNEYNPRIWSDNTGYSLDELWELYSLQ